MMRRLFYLLTTVSLVQCVQFLQENRPRRHTGYYENLSTYQFFKTPVSVWLTQPFPPKTSTFMPHVTPDFSNGLEYPDPLLLIGLQAKRAAQYLYSKELFFEDIPHVSAILRNQEVRRANGLSGNRLGSLRATSPFHRYNKNRL